MFRILMFLALLAVVACGQDKSGSDNALTQKAQKNGVNSSDDVELLKKGAKAFTKKASNRPHDTLSAAEIAQLQHGDVLLRKGYGMVSDFITDFLAEKYTITHCGFVIREPNNDTIKILHTVSNEYSKGMLIEPLSDYLENSQVPSLAAVRPKFSEREKLLALDQAFDLLHRNVEFDMEFDDRDSSKLYCVEMVRNAYFRVVKKDILPKRISRMGIEVTQMSNFFEPKYFEVIFNHCKPNF